VKLIEQRQHAIPAVSELAAMRDIQSAPIEHRLGPDEALGDRNMPDDIAQRERRGLVRPLDAISWNQGGYASRPLPHPFEVAQELIEVDHYVSFTGSVRVSLIDTDVQDVLYVRIFVDYNLPESQPERLPPRASCEVGPSGDAVRTTTCDMSGVCAAADIGVQRNMTIVVFDRQPVDTGSDPRVMMGDGLSTSRFYFLKCQLPQST